MQGFDRKFKDFPGYLMTTSRDIWERRGLAARMQEYMHPEVIERSAQGILYGEGALTAAVLSTLVAFPDLELLAEDVIWSGAPERGMLGSQRTVARGRHLGEGIYGAPTGKAFSYRIMSDSFAKANRVSDIWRVPDSAALLAQLGLDVRDWARERMALLEPSAAPLRPEVDAIGPYTGRGNDNQWGVAFATILDRIMAGELSVIAEQYDRACQMAYPGGLEAHGRAQADRFWLGLRASFPSARFQVHHRIGREDPMLPPRAALRWSLTGRHDGWGAFGRPTGAEVHVMGISHAEFGPGGLRREWTLFDAAAIWMQIAMAEG
jgi:predicted ester cyclase